MKLGIIGYGFVGSAVDHGFTHTIDKLIVDPKHNNNSIQDLINFKPDATFVCVPTPQSVTGECDVSILFDVMKQLNNYTQFVILKSTVPSYMIEKIIKQFSNIRLVYNPEFLTEKNYINDFCNPSMHIFGGEHESTDWVENLYKNHSICKPCPVFKTDIITASMIKYCINSFLATKVTFMNEMYDVLKSAGGADWETFAKIIATDPRIGATHLKVPGNDGQRGYAGSCFPKDTSALAYFAREILKTPFTQLEKTIDINNNLRREKQ